MYINHEEANTLTQHPCLLQSICMQYAPTLQQQMKCNCDWITFFYYPHEDMWLIQNVQIKKDCKLLFSSLTKRLKNLA